MRRLTVFAFAVLLGAGCAGQRPALPSAAFELQPSEKFFAKPPAPSALHPASDPSQQG